MMEVVLITAAVSHAKLHLKCLSDESVYVNSVCVSMLITVESGLD